MGLSLSCGVDISYGGFANFRDAVAKEIGIDLDEMIGFGGVKSFKEVKNPIKHLLNHSDCDGYIGEKMCGKMFPELKKIADKWLQSSNENEKYYGRLALYLSEGMKECFDNDEPLLFE